MAQNKNYKNIGKKDIILVISQLIKRIDAIELTLNTFVKFVDKDNKFNEFIQKELGGTNDTRTNESDNNRGDTAENQSSS
jgi:hypothetical protein